MTKSRFNEIKDEIMEANKNKLVTSISKRTITLKNAEELLEGIISGKIDRKKAKKIYNSIAEDANKLDKLKVTESTEKMLPIFVQLQEVFNPKTDDKADNEEIDATNIPDLEESEESAEQTPQQILTRLSNSLA